MKVLLYFRQSQNKKLREALSYEQRSSKMFMKLTPVANQKKYSLTKNYSVFVVKPGATAKICRKRKKKFTGSATVVNFTNI
jgi:hypothetical protein